MSDTAPTTLNELFLGAIARFRTRPVAMRRKTNGSWAELSYTDLLERVKAVSHALATLGVRAGDRVAILSENRPEWAIADYATLALGAADVPIYPTLPARQVAYILRDSGATVAFVSSQSQLNKLREVQAECPALQHIVTFDAVTTPGDALAMATLVAEGQAAPTAAWEAAARRITADDLATLIYTSGTTGDPKGVMLTHGNITSNVVLALTRIQLSGEDECLSFLPLSHIFERMAGHYLMLHCGALINYAGGIDTVSADMVDRRPTVMLSVPRLYEKIFARVQDSAASGSTVKRRIFRWARQTGDRWAEAKVAGRVPAGLQVAHALADRLVFTKLRERTGGRLRFFVSGGAPLNPEIARFFYASGLPILEGYGLTETSPVIAVNTFEDYRFGTVGKPIPRSEVRIEADGEILTRGPHVMRGYYGKPDATREVLTPDGWFHTGDIGELSADGFLRITDRKKDLIVTAGGKNIAPQPIENMVKTSRYITNAVMIGDRRSFPIMLLVPNVPVLHEWAKRHGLAVTGDEALLAHPDTMEKLEREVRRTLRDLARFEVPKRFVLVPQDFSIEAGEMTPTLKVRRRVVEEKYRVQIEATYAGAPEA
ncbi:MAG TPA: long-chain fatty acid--CoA ligase [Gemmatimonadales bacterium]|nr:long-chain fatty acid--CoA ligase [Gemmatimonadales bacterium]